MSYPKGHHPGAVWKKADLQVHSPRDPQWSGSPSLPGGNEAAEGDRRRWADDFVVTCVSKGIHAVAITDHHDVCFAAYVRNAIGRYQPEQSRPWFFPGMEMTCNDSVQCLVLFDAKTEMPTWRRLFGGHLNGIAEPDERAATAPQATLCGKDLKEFLQGMAADTSLAGRSIVLPHGGDENAHKTIIRRGFQSRFFLDFDGV